MGHGVVSSENKNLHDFLIALYGLLFSNYLEEEELSGELNYVSRGEEWPGRMQADNGNINNHYFLQNVNLKDQANHSLQRIMSANHKSPISHSSLI